MDTAADNGVRVMPLDHFVYLMGQEPVDRKAGYEVTGMDDDGVLDGDMIVSALISDTVKFNDAITVLYGIDFEVCARHDWRLNIGRCSRGTPLCRVMGLETMYRVADARGNLLSEAELARHVSDEFKPGLFDSFDLSNAVVGDVYPQSWLAG